MRGFFLGVIFTILAIVIGGYLIMKQGYVDFSADQRPTSTEMHFAMAAVDASTDRHASDQKNPLQPTDETLVAGAIPYRDHCAGCHGTPWNSDSQFGRSFNPPVPQFFKEGSDMADNQSFYIIQHGIRWTGMPSWKQTLSDTQTWQVVTFLSHMSKLPPAAQKEHRTASVTGSRTGRLTEPMSRRAEFSAEENHRATSLLLLLKFDFFAGRGIRSQGPDDVRLPSAAFALIIALIIARARR